MGQATGCGRRRATSRVAKKNQELRRLQELLDREKEARLELEHMYAAQTEESETLKRRIELENSLWESDAAGRRLEPGADPRVMHAWEMLDGTMRNGDLLVRTTKFTPEKFDFLLDKFNQRTADHPKTTPLFRGDGAGSGRRGNRCNLDIKHVLLMALIHYKSNPSQDSLEAQFAVDRSSVSRYLKWAKGVLGEILPTGKNICKRIQDAKTVGEMNEIMSLGSKSETDGEYELLARFARILGLSPVFGLNDSRMRLFEEFKQITRNPNAVLMLDDTHVRIVRPATPSTGVPGTRERRGTARLTPT